MRPVSIRFKCFGPYMEEQFIDFSLLEKSGLFLICGETGSGKTTILDAMSYALYGRSSGALRGDLSVMRCKLAQPKDETLVEFVFDNRGSRYKFTRSLKYGRKNLNDFHNCMELRDGVYVPLFENPKQNAVNKKAEEIIGLTYEQFRQVIILPQGQFEKLLVSKSEDKEAILVSLFHADRWQRIAAEIHRRVSERDSAIKQERSSIDVKLREYGCKDLAALESLAVICAQETVDAKNASALSEQALSAVKKQKDQALLENQSFAELAQRQKRLAMLQPKQARFEAEQKLLESADRAEQIMSDYTAFNTAKTGKDKAERSLASCRQKEKLANTAYGTALKSRADHEMGRTQFEEQKQRILLLENAAPHYRSLEQKKSAFHDALAAQKLAEKASMDQKSAFDKADQRWQQAMQRREQADEAFRKAQSIYLRGIGSILAQKLALNEPCPVCGSTHHPNPAKPADDHISEAEFDRFSQEVTRCSAAVTQTHQERTAAQGQYDRAQTALTEAQRKAAVALAEFDAAKAQLIPGIDTQLQLDAKLRTLKEEVNRYAQADEETQSALNRTLAERQSAQQNVESASEAYDVAAAEFDIRSTQWLQALETAGFSCEGEFAASCIQPQEKQRRRQALTQFQTDLSNAQLALQEQQELLADKTAPNLSAIEQAVTAAQNAAIADAQKLALAEKRQQSVERDNRLLAEKSKKLDELRIEVDADLAFADRLRGRSGCSLQRYVLGVMLTAITREANRLLENVYGGRYRLYRTDETSGGTHKSGLELEVFDSNHQARRSVTTLSGGEKFLVALSLAIGLSAVVQAQGHGIRLEAMFVDEGFGSLDRDSICDALEVLQGIQRGAGVVGIISHVEQLAETIPTKIVITKTKNGSQSTIVR